MTKVTGNFSVGTADSVANVKEAWGGISAMLDAIGMAKTADTGQMVVSSLTVPSVSTYPVYEIRSWTDSVGTLYMKWEYGVGNNTTRPYHRITIGTGSNGSGTITGAIFTQHVFGGSSTGAAAYGATPQFACLSSGAFAIVLNGSGTCGQFFFMYDRQRNSAGTAVAGGHYTISNVHGGAVTARTRVDSPVVDRTCATGMHLFNPNYSPTVSMSGLGLEASTQDLMPLFGSYPDPAVQLCGISYWQGEATYLQPITATVCGASHTFLGLMLGAATLPVAYGSAGSANTYAGLAMIWE